MNDLTKQNSGNLPSVDEDFVARLMTGIAETKATTVVAGGMPFFRLARSGIFIYGQNNEEVQDGSHWAVNIRSMSHGYSCWVDGGPGQVNSLAGEVMTPMTSPKPPRPDPIDGTPFKDQCSFTMKCLNGDDKGVEVIYKINSVGGIRAIMGLLTAIYDQAAHDKRYICPVLTFTSESYPHKKWGEIFVPLFNVVGWCDMNGEMKGAPAPKLAASPAEKPAEKPAAPARKRKAPLSPDAASVAAPTVAAPPVQPAPTAQGHVGQRRRPAAS